MKPEIALGIGLTVGLMIGIMWEHNRLLKEIQGLTKKHAATPQAPTIPTDNGAVNNSIVENPGASETQVS